ncbi:MULTISPECIES: DUF4389 domain-containing protein [unclassified Isoptericola]|uniref:DUF4389 domain-containing protein n=1 Tax=unclassified Isoptericola TaxID=2623355 RepID=UPI002713CD51|nr:MULTISPECIES: DUF4389 domain-containing protein [unclassified Isoptericola]MDO8145468.1 DUF4389 domain-containing protein [Isoptericola sp. 178]MDO8149109.1 DUF4389 domain-containing protein [Isoptericola sp. b515]MDO8150945.1 DUF4389 domain-containing protein [Isoptericola sp. b408]
MTDTNPPRPTGPAPYPLRMDAEPPAQLSRGLWLVKWLLIFPHVVILIGLWIAFAVLTVIAFFAILFTGRYPQGIFTFNVGVLRWSWRVSYYSYGALGTDRYPPFTLADVPDYPTHLDVTPPQHLSRGLVLVKWWLLAIPHYIVVGILLGTSSRTTEIASDGTVVVTDWPPGVGLVGVLVFFAAVVLLFRGDYPRGIYELVLGLQRWALRVAAYAALMTDEYPPFRLDMGARETVRGPADPGPPPPSV